MLVRWPVSCNGLLGRAFLGFPSCKVDPESLVYGLRGRKFSSDIGIENNHVRAAPKSLSVLSADALGEVILLSHFHTF